MKKLYASLFLAALLGSSFVGTVALANASTPHEEEKKDEAAEEEKKDEAAH